jgi:hypothetical protein
MNGPKAVVRGELPKIGDLGLGISREVMRPLTEVSKALAVAQVEPLRKSTGALIAEQMKPLNDAAKQLSASGILGKNSC